MISDPKPQPPPTTAPITNGFSLTHDESDAPVRVQELKHDSSVLALAVSDKYIFAGTHDGELIVWSLGTFELVRRIQAHKRHILWLFLSGSSSSTTHSDSSQSSPDSTSANSRPLLISSAGDALVSVWCPNTFTRLYEIYSVDHVGDVFSCAYSSQQDTVYIGAQDQSIQWVRLNDRDRRVPHNNPSHPDQRHHPFFDSKAPGGASTPRRKDKREELIPKPEATLEIDRGSVGKFAHFGFVYCMIIARGPTVLVDSDEEVLISGGGDGSIKLWQIKQDEKYEGYEEWDAWEKREIMCLRGDDDDFGESVFSLAIDGSFLYSGKKKGIIELWDLDTKQKLRVIKGHRGDVMALQLSWGYLLSGATTGSAAVSLVLMCPPLGRPRSRTQLLTTYRNIVLFTTARTIFHPRPPRRSARNIDVSRGGRPTTARSCLRHAPTTTETNCTSPAPTTTPSAFGASTTCVNSPKM